MPWWLVPIRLSENSSLLYKYYLISFHAEIKYRSWCDVTRCESNLSKTSMQAKCSAKKHAISVKRTMKLHTWWIPRDTYLNSQRRWCELGGLLGRNNFKIKKCERIWRKIGLKGNIVFKFLTAKRLILLGTRLWISILLEFVEGSGLNCWGCFC